MFLKKHEVIYQNNTVNADSYDKRRFNELLKLSKGLKQTKEQGDNEFPLFSQLMGDIWSSLYKSKPQLLKDIPVDLQINRSYMEKVIENQAFEANRETTKLDDLSSALSTISFCNKVMDWIKDRKEQNEEFQNALRDIMNALNENHQNSLEQTDGNKTPSQQVQKNLEEKLNKLAHQLQNELSDSENVIAEMINQSVNEANENKNNMKNLLSGMTASNGAAEFEKVPLREKFALAEALKNSPKMRDISEWAGRFKQIARSKQKSNHHESIDRNGVSIGNEIEHLLPTELSNMVIPEAKLDFLRKYVEGQTLIYDKKGKESLGKGPIILCLDESGSMRDLETQSKGFALALMSIAKKQKRDFALISFSMKALVKIFPKGKCKTQDLVSLAESFMNGGTNFYDPLKKSLDLINQSRFKNADIIFVTDGDAQLPEEFIAKFNDAKKQKRFECLSVLIGNETKDRTVNKFSDKVIFAKDFTEAEKVFGI